ncbi:MAG TPA: copper chaperone PCu(A)C [Povalibacter sp.]|mgnify:CR=1 FL=1|uniref:copper chaperone PCu(A)C n=1 Tax=Povalibacter sp. TaxID=1962978 RepID=UPI002B7D6D24|nr:copper chaperone PCu(A)C [Povalibacter sp.]HMN46138.1 copper chaperone PCu(A)C [Povalibacter sp.]
MKPRRSLLMAALALIALHGCGQAQGPSVTVRDAWSPAAPPGAAVVAIYGELIADRDDVLIRIRTPAADRVELHATSEENGMMKMRPVTRLELKAGTPVQLAPGGMHLMVMGLHEPIAAGGEIPVTFEFEHAGKIAVSARVNAPQ